MSDHSHLSTSDLRHLAKLNERLQIIRDRVHGVSQGYNAGLYIVGRSGTSKTYTVVEELRRADATWIRRNARMSAMGLFELLSDYPEHSIVLDDVPSLFADKQAIQILLPALDGNPGTPRKVTYKTRDRDERVEFSGGIIGISNLELRNDPLANALASRVVMLEHEPTDDEIASFMKSLAVSGYKGLSSDECLEVVTFLITEMRDFDRRLDLRYLNKAYEDYRQYKDGNAKTGWKNLVRTSLRKLPTELNVLPTKQDEIRQQIELVGRLIEKYPKNRRRQIKESGLSQSTFYERLRVLKHLTSH